MRATAKYAGTLALAAAAMLFGCAKPEYLGNSAKGFWSDQAAPYGPNEAFNKAQPFLEATWKARCEEVRNHDEWCDKPPVDHMIRKGDVYYLTRTSYPYKNHEAYMEYAVKVNAQTGEVTPYE